MRPAPTYDVFLALRSARLCVGHLRAVGIEATARTIGVDLYYRADTDVVLLGLRLDPRTATHTLIDRLHSEAAVAGAAVLEPARLDEADRARFYDEHLPSYPLKVSDFPTVADAVRKLAGDLGFKLDTPAPGGPAQVEVRFRAGERWQLGRARSLSREGCYIYSGSAPRVGEQIMLRLSSGQGQLTVKAEVVHATPEDAALTVGGVGFASRFILGSQAERHALEGMVVAGRVDGLGALRPAPPRRESRYALRWPVAVQRHEQPLSALDVSRHGLFVATSAPFPDGSVEVALSPDDGGAAIRARARVARRLDDEVAQARGVAAGCGLELERFAPGDGERFATFVTRVGQRANKRLLVGAGEARQRLLVAPLANAGYVVAAAAEPAEILAAALGCDLVILDSEFNGSQGRSNDIRRALAARRVQAYTLEPGQTGRGIRGLADAALLG